MDDRIYELFHLCLGPAGGRIKIYPNAKDFFPCNEGILKQKGLTILDTDDPPEADVLVFTYKDLRVLRWTRAELPRAKKVLLLKSRPDSYLVGDMERASLAGLYSSMKHYGILPRIQDPRWIIPLEKGKVSASSLDIYQPSLLIPRLAKRFAQFVLRINSRFLPMDILSIYSNDDYSGIYDLIKIAVSIPPPEIALFTGTQGHYRKVTALMMDQRGNILGYAKIAETEQSRKLIRNEARTLANLSRLNIMTAKIPELLFYQEKERQTLLFQSPCPKPFWLTNFSLRDIHLAFLEELFLKTFSINSLPLSQLSCFNPIKEMVGRSMSCLPADLGGCLRRGAETVGAYVPRALCFSHGDFTPWNTSVKHRKLFVFDWEYANIEPPLMDVIHFVMQYMILVKKAKTEELLKATYEALSLFLSKLKLNIKKNELKFMLMYYLLKMISLKCQTGKYSECTEEEKRAVTAWGKILDALLTCDGKA